MNTNIHQQLYGNASREFSLLIVSDMHIINYRTDRPSKVNIILTDISLIP